jgi:uncharacterized protein (TIGR00369 family)
MSDLAGDLQNLIDRSPYLSWLGLRIIALQDDKLEAQATWREEWVANPSIGQTQGGILAALVDFAADFSLFPRVGRPVPTIDMRVDYHRLAKKGDLLANGYVVKYGVRISVAEAKILSPSGDLIASGRGTYLTAPLGE